ncbi:MAG: hypothetical protein KME60_34135 [Cyanomargarita calcarea GSE-NOS-MK-12-04C]|uniref:Uncharacterized protein n=1 Tax=Cyanomargarita calcarea GSE-NOS-MK-12-04C TaxID=2839659 RepID=A0A951QYK4_9CYAN|nr:hypothetical protein [Cyanomargarita calcarea GSE-NOS-MK-12-04C]
MSFASSTCCVAVLNQQQEAYFHHKNECQNIPLNECKTSAKSCTIVENGRVVVKPLQDSVEDNNTDG